MRAAWALSVKWVVGAGRRGGIVYPLVYGYVANVHMGDAVVALVCFVPLVLFYVWAVRYEADPREHGLCSARRWLGGDATTSAGGDDR
ncbi:hypothetical protein EI982_10150 [Haloplanus rallus]|jgi:NNP family nitrate/nitrite transporter-like MFS transporter|uniref:Uncharacterized protein n=1 Tax=Haloplanus rallus TaxID=1816183 RepID=A0A6B9F485_9EURY|nr:MULTISPECIES: hypothetical protein [Haloplanus]QGX95128.1 hypothetical protein EI982_10150 [Haloplanus rallus]